MSSISDEEWQKMSPEERMNFQMSNCIFCKIIKGEISSKKVYDDDEFVGILDVNPGAKGHVLILPKKHIQIMPQLGTELSGKLGVVAKTISNKLTKGLGVRGTSVFIANGIVAGQNAPHFMMHVLPRKSDDEISLNPEPKTFDETNINSLRQKIISSLGLPVPGEEQKQEPKTNTEETPQEQKEEPETNNEEKTQEQKEEPQKPDKELLDKIKNMFD